ncbi:MAG: DUF3427 domain-containing protein [Archangiaceae bacterium]|nr:DUF3427 domain-containing protein [Archangiaceae bacterium]
MRLSNIDNAAVQKFITTFDQYWADPQFEPYDRERFVDAARHRDADRDALARVVRLSPLPHQQVALDALAQERHQGHSKNLVVAATGTGKTVIAALDFARLHAAAKDLSLLFIAHRQEILRQSLATFRAAMRDGHFGELLVSDERPVAGRHVFASIQSMHRRRLEKLAPDAYDVVIVDEFHHAEADTYSALLEHLKPKVLLGLTATPERTDGKSILGWFDHRIASEVRLWDAIELGLVVPFQYFGIHDDVDLSTVDFRAGRYDVARLEVPTPPTTPAPAPCSALSSATSATFTRCARSASASASSTPSSWPRSSRATAYPRSPSRPTPRRPSAPRPCAGCSAARCACSSRATSSTKASTCPRSTPCFFLRPTESATVFLQQLGRGLRHEDGKECLTVLDCRRRQSRLPLRRPVPLLARHSHRAGVIRAVEEGFPISPAGCEISSSPRPSAPFSNIREHLGASNADLVKDLRRIGDVRLPQFLRACELAPEDLYRPGTGRTLENLKRLAGLARGEPEADELDRSFARLLHVDDEVRLETWRRWLEGAKAPPTVGADDPLMLMLFVSLGGTRRPVAELKEALHELWSRGSLRTELADLLGLLADRSRKPTYALDGLTFRVHATYSRDEISAGLLQVRDRKLMRTQGGVYKDDSAKADIFYVTLDKDPAHFTPTTLYNDYPISPTRFHWETQSKTREDSETGRRYRGEHPAKGWRHLLFVRRAKVTELGVTAPYLFLGPVRYVSHESEKPMRIVWELERAMPASFFNEVKIAAG